MALDDSGSKVRPDSAMMQRGEGEREREDGKGGELEQIKAKAL
jgi:hypothetical protein